MILDNARVLVATGWYPSYDMPGRASFVADQVAALRASGLALDVATWEIVYRYASRSAPGDQGAAQLLPDALRDAIRSSGVSVEPRAWGAAGVPVVRLPAVAPFVRGVSPDPRTVAGSAASALLAWADNPRFQRPTIVHAHVGLPDGVAATVLADRLGVPLVVTEHDSTAAARIALPGMREAYLQLLREGRLLVAVSDSLRGRLASALGIDPSRIAVVPNVVDVAAFAAHADDGARDPDELLWVGGLKATKGADLLLEAFALARSSRPALRLRLIGGVSSAPEADRLHALARDLGIAGSVTFEGQLSRDGVRAAMARAAVFVHPSPAETFGVVAAEALAAGLPVAATPSGGVDEIVGRDGRFGEIAAAHTAAALADAVTRVLEDPSRFDPAAMRTHALDRYSPEVVAGRLREHYAELLERAAPPATGGPALTSTRARADVPGAGRERGRRAVVVVGLRPALARKRVSTLPAALADGLFVITTTSQAAEALPDGPRWIELDPDSQYRAARRRLAGRPGRGLGARVLRVARNPLRPIRIRQLEASRATLTLESVRAGIATFLAQLDPDVQVEVLALTADDAEVVEPMLGDRVVLLPTTIRGLVERWDAAGRPANPLPAMTAAPTRYDPTQYWERLHQRGDLSTVGQSGLSARLNAWLYRSLEANVRRFLGRHALLSPAPLTAFDVGTGIGYWVRFWRSLGVARVDGCDLIPSAVESARSVAREVGATGEYLVADLSQPGALAGRTYHIVSCFNVLLHVVDDASFSVALDNVAGLVAEGGHLVLAEPILLDPAQARPRTETSASRARPLADYRDGLVAAGLELVALEPATVLANNPIEARSPWLLRQYQRWWRFVVRRDREGARWIGPLVRIADRVAIRTGQAPTTKLALFRRPPG